MVISATENNKQSEKGGRMKGRAVTLFWWNGQGSPL